tara:strand:+ start:315 stop:722 length:408 start_codon:yes stop_codon:yes gene_type:complete
MIEKKGFSLQEDHYNRNLAQHSITAQPHAKDVNGGNLEQLRYELQKAEEAAGVSYNPSPEYLAGIAKSPFPPFPPVPSVVKSEYSGDNAVVLRVINSMEITQLEKLVVILEDKIEKLKPAPELHTDDLLDMLNNN